MRRKKVRTAQPQPLPVKLEREGWLLVAKSAVKVPPLRVETVERTLRQLRAERGKISQG